MNNNITACHYRTSTEGFDNHVCKCGNENEHVAKEPYFKFYGLMTGDNKNKICYESQLHKKGFDAMNW